MIILFSFSSNSLLAQPITFVFDGSENNQSTVTKTVSGVTMTLSNELPNNDFHNLFGNGVIFLGSGTSAFTLTASFDINFSSGVQLVSYNVEGGSTFGLNGGESLTFTDGSSTSVENIPFVGGNRNFANPFNVSANTTISMTGDFGVAQEQNEFITIASITVLPVPSADVPTLSQWGLIILALSFMTLGTLYLLQPKFRGRFGFEQELVDGKEL